MHTFEDYLITIAIVVFIFLLLFLIVIIIGGLVEYHMHRSDTTITGYCKDCDYYDATTRLCNYPTQSNGFRTFDEGYCHRYICTKTSR